MDEVRVIQFYEHGRTVLNPVVIVVLVVAAVLILALPRRFALIPMALTAILIPDMQRIVIAGFDFNVLRILSIAGMARILVRTRTFPVGYGTFSRVYLAWIAAGIALYSLQLGTFEAFAYKVGAAVTALGVYVFVKHVVRSEEDLLLFFQTAAVACIIIAVTMLFEMRKGASVFSFLGGIPDAAVVRSGRIRCQGPFSHPILAGTFGAVSFPLMIALLVARRRSLLALLGVLASLVIVVTSASSGPLLSLVVSVLGLAAWVVRKNLREVRFAILFVVLLLAVYMQRPIWWLLARIDVVGGSTGYHRYLLIDAFIRNFRQWVAVGTDQAQYWGWGLQDITNQYVLEGLEGGLLTLVLFIALIVLAFARAGAAVRGAGTRARWREFVWWAIGVQMLTHAVTFMSVSYFDQSVFLLFATFALLAASPAMVERGGEEIVPAVSPAYPLVAPGGSGVGS